MQVDAAFPELKDIGRVGKGDGHKPFMIHKGRLLRRLNNNRDLLSKNRLQRVSDGTKANEGTFSFHKAAGGFDLQNSSLVPNIGLGFVVAV